MVIHENKEAPDEVSNKGRHLEPKKYVIVKNHVRELTIDDKKQSAESSTAEKVPEMQKLKRTKKSSKSLKNPELSSSSIQNDVTELAATDISKSDLEELRTVYNKCKDVMKRIESKYGHLLELDNRSTPENYIDSDKCNCSSNKKIIFDENGQQLLKETNSDIHICPQKLKRRHSNAYQPDFHSMLSKTNKLDIQYEEFGKSMPDDLQSLGTILQDSNIEITYRNTVINKIKLLKQEHLNEIRFNRPSLIEKLKVTPDEVFEFKGANLSTLPGYPDGK